MSLAPQSLGGLRLRVATVRAFLLAFLLGTPASAQLIPWIEPPVMSGTGVPPVKSAGLRDTDVPPVKSTAEVPLALPATASALEDSLWNLLTPPAPLVLTTFTPTDPGAVRAGTTWLGQVTQHVHTLTVAGTAADDNGWGATGLSLDATPYTYLNLTAQRDPGHAAPTLFLQFEDRTLRTKIYSLSTSLFAIGTLTTVQIPLDGWTINFGTHDLTGWSIGGGSVGTVPFRMTFDELSFTTSAIPEPATYAALLGLIAALAAVRRKK